MITNPFARKPRTPLDRALATVEDVRAEAATTAAAIRDAAAKAADALGEPPVPGGRKLPVIAVAAAAALGVAIAIKSRAGRGAPAPAPEAPRPAPATATAARATATDAPVATGSKPAAEVAPEEPREPRAETEESEASSSKG